MRSSYTQAMGNTAVSRVQNIINLHFPAGRPAEPVHSDVLFHSDFSAELADDADGKVLPPVAVFPALSASPGIWHRNSSSPDTFIAASTTTTAGSIPPPGASGNAAARIGSDNSTVLYLHTVLDDVFAPESDYGFSFATRLAIADGSAGSDPNAFGQVKLSVGYVNADDSLNSFFSNAAKEVMDVGTSTWTAHSSRLAASAIPADAIGKRIYLRLTHNIANTPGYFVWVDHFRIGVSTKSSRYADWAGPAFSGTSSSIDRTLAGNPDGDDRNNELEWVMVTDPLKHDVPFLETSRDATHFMIRYQRRLNSGFTVGASWADSLADPFWRKDNMVEIPAGQAGDIQTMSVALPIDGPRKFVRIGAGK
jgi:hypothetical protein